MRAGFTFLEVMVVVTIIGLVVAVAIPNYVKSREYSRLQLCYQNLSKIEAAKQTWAMENGKRTGDVPQDGDLYGPNSYIRVPPACPSGGAYTLNPIGTNVVCSTAGHNL
jgi:prepilin-type N-terminal cleavage/methylation domain-containing protein